MTTLNSTDDHAARELQRLVVQFVRAFGLHHPEQTPCGQALGVAEAHTLMELAHGALINQQQLADRLVLQKSTVSRLVSGLERRGWVQRERSPHDARAVALSLTAEGKRIAAQVAAARAMRFSSIIQTIPLADRPRVLSALQTLVEASYDRNT